ncbi:hypothetical protein [Paenibacillus sp. YIM B09110]|uniref:hypothetical protein n=1 Tax=Paenibacillus sp. YIM B09110 TaxID=3126102 RepID=UPI00301E6004
MRKGLIILLILSIGINGFLFVNGKSKQKELENAIIMNEFENREKELRILKSFIDEIANNSDGYPYYNDEQSDLYWILEQPYISVMPNVTGHIKSVEWDLFLTYSDFLVEFDSACKRIVESLKTKLPLMSKEQLVTLSNRLDTIYVSFTHSLEGWGVSSLTIRTSVNKLDVQFEPQIELLDEVLQELEAVFEELESLN